MHFQAGGSQRKQNTPKIYLPRIGLRLVKKYVGVDFKKMSLTGDIEEQRRLNTALHTTFNLNKPFPQPEPEQNSFEKRYSLFLEQSTPLSKSKTNEALVVKKHIQSQLSKPREAKQSSRPNSRKTPDVIHKVEKDDVVGLAEKKSEFNLHRRERPLDETSLSFQHNDAQRNTEESEAAIQTVQNENICPNEIIEDTDIHCEEVFDEPEIENGRTLLETTYNLTERRSSRSTFRTRSSARLMSQKSFLSEYNMEVIGMSRTKKSNKIKRKTKEKIGQFYLDYGDGKLHDNTQIPRIRDCSRSWCNPHCRTCKMRTPGRPCFVLVPIDDIGRKRKIPTDKRISMFQAYSKLGNALGARPEAHDNNIDKELTEQRGVPNSATRRGSLGSTKNERKQVQDTEKEPSEKEIVETDGKPGNSDEKETETNEIKNFMKEVKGKRIKERTFSKKRLDELAQPRGGPPAEVRFSKMTLRKEQDKLIESERTKELTKYEQDNLTFIQGKISLFLALLNQQEMNGKPPDIMSLPLREKLKTATRVKKPRNVQRRLRKVNFSPNTRFRLLS